METEQMRAALSMLAANGGEVYGRTRMQKLMFLAQQGIDYGAPPFRFIAWDYGPYSKDLQECLNGLVDLGLLEEGVAPVKSGHEAYRYKLTEGGSRVLADLASDDGTEQARFRELVAEWGQKDLDTLIRHVYAEHPDFARRSKYGAA